jgi:hypothetical protein
MNKNDFKNYIDNTFTNNGRAAISGTTINSGFTNLIDSIVFNVNNVVFNTVIPLYYNCSYTLMSNYTISGATTFTISGNTEGSTVICNLTSDGVNTPVFSGFTKWIYSENYNTTLNKINQVIFFYLNGISYYNIIVLN